MSVLIVDSIDGFVDPAREPFEVLGPRDIEIDDFEAMTVRYGITELCCALKPSILRHLLRPDETTIYLDSDIRAFAPFDGLNEALEAKPLLLTPHLLEPLPEDGFQPDELAILLAGTFNLGFAAARLTPEVEMLLSWWAERLRRGCRLDPAHGMVYDQRWADLMPGMSECLGVLRDPGWNFGYWRAGTSELERVGEQILVDGHPLRCLHFTGFDPKHPERLSMYDNRVSLERHPLLRDLCGQFTEQLYECGHSETSTWAYDFGNMASGAPLTPELRELWSRASDEGAILESPFTAEGERAFLSWLSTTEPGAARLPLNRYLAALHGARADLSKSFPDLHGPDQDGYVRWAEEEARRHPDGVLGLLRQRTETASQPGLRELLAGETLGVERDDVVVCIPVYGAPELFAECLTSVLAHTPRGTHILVADDASPDPAIHTFLASLKDVLQHQIAYLRQPKNLGFPGNVNAAFAAAAPADVIVLNSDCVVAAGWLEGLQVAARSDGLVATASALTNHGTILTVPERNRPQSSLPQDQDLAHIAGAVMEQSLRLYPRLPTAIGHCMYVRRQALDLVGDFDLAFSPGYGEEVDFSQRCLLYGLVHVAADDVFVLHHSSGSFAEDGEANPAREEHENIINARYPYYQRAQTASGNAQFGPLPRALSAARRAIKGITITVDARCLGPVITGTQVHTLELIRALSRTNHAFIRVIVPPQVGAYAEEQLKQMGHVELVSHHAIHPGMEKTDVAHRPYQVNNSNDLLVLRCAGERQIITHQDLIAYRNPGYFPGYPQWKRYQQLTRQALATADSVVFFSNHAARDSLNEDLVDAARSHVAYIGVDHPDLASPVAPERPSGTDSLADRPMLLCLGTDFRHKNRVFALRLLESLRKDKGWDGVVVFAGPRVSYGSSAGEEAAYLATKPDLADSVLTLPAVSEAEKAWLLERSVAVLYPTTFEGFGLMPFEAAAHNRPCLFATHTALVETLPPELATLVPWDPRESAERVHRLLSTPRAVAEHVSAIRRAGSRFTWESTADQLLDLYWAAACSSTRDASLMAEQLKEVEDERNEAERKYNELWRGLTPEVQMLVRPDGPLSPQAQHSLATIARRPMLRRLFLGPIQFTSKVRKKAGSDSDRPEEPTTAPQALALHFAPANSRHMVEQLAHSQTEDDTSACEPEPLISVE